MLDDAKRVLSNPYPCCKHSATAAGQTAETERLLSDNGGAQRLKGMTHSSLLGPEILPLVKLSENCVTAQLEDRRIDVVGRFELLTPEQQRELARESWRIGLSAVLTAHATAQEAKLADVGKTLLADLDHQLQGHTQRQEQEMKKVLDRFFDPNDGQVTERLKAFVSDKGVLASLLREFVGGDGSVLAQTLSRQVGENSPLLKRLSPTESGGIVQLLERKVAEALASSRAEVAKTLDPLSEDGAVARFLAKLQDDLKKAEGEQSEQLIKALAALDQNNEQSLISRLLKESRESQETLRKALNPQLPDSPLGAVRKTLEEVLEQRLGRQEQRLEALQKSQHEFHVELQAAVTRLDTRREELARSTHGGTVFEEQVLAFLGKVVPQGLCTVETTGNRAGLTKNCKKGDAVVTFAEDSAFAGARMVVEAKRDQTYQVGDALSELDEAMANRGAATGVFVISKASAPANFPSFARYGRKLLVVWNPEDEISSGLLHGALVAGLALAQGKKSLADDGDIIAPADVERRLVVEIERLAKMDTEASTIAGAAAKIRDEVRKGSAALERVVKNAKSTLRALNVELHDDAAEVASPILAPAYVPGGEANDVVSASAAE